MSKRQTLVIAVDGPILVLSGEVDPHLHVAVAKYASGFLMWATEHFDVVLLSDRPFRDTQYLLSKLGLPVGRFAVRSFVDSKTEALNATTRPYWVDGDLIPSEVAWIAQHGWLDRFFQVDPVKGVTPELKARIERQLNKKHV